MSSIFSNIVIDSSSNIKEGIVNLKAHIDILKNMTKNIVVCLNKYENDTEEDILNELAEEESDSNSITQVKNSLSRFVNHQDLEGHSYLYDEVKVLSGPFAGRTGRVESIDRDKETAIVLVEFLGNSTPMEVELIQLEKAEL